MSLLIYITLPEAEQASSLADGLVAARLVAGVHISGPVHSVYRWRGEICHRDEWRILAQAGSKNFDAIRRFVCARHPYEVPCIMAVDISAGHQPFLDWIERAGE